MKFLLTNAEMHKLRNDLKAQAVKEYIESQENKQRGIEQLISQRSKCAVYFNFNDPNVIVFSVERLDIGSLQERTVIGYYLKAEAIKSGAEEKKAIREWTLLCSREQHNELVKKFDAVSSKQLLKG